MQPVEIGVRRKIDLDPTIATTAHPYVPMYNNHMWERVLKIGNQMWVGEETGLWFEPGDHVYPCTGTIFDYYPFTEMQRVVLNEDGEEIQVEGPGSEINETTQSNIMVRCPKVFFKDEWTVEEEGVWGYEYHWMCKYKADNLYYVDSLHQRYDGQIFNGYCYVSCYTATYRSNIPYSFKNTTSSQSNIAIQNIKDRFNNKNNAATKNVDWQPININYIFGYLNKLSLISQASNYTCRKTNDSVSEYAQLDITQCQPNDFFLRFGNRINRGTYPLILFNKFLSTKQQSSNEYMTYFGFNIVNNNLYFNTNYRENYETSYANILNNWTQCPYFSYNSNNNYSVYSVNHDNNYLWVEYPSWLYTSKQFYYGENSWCNIGTSSNVVYYPIIQESYGTSFYYFNFSRTPSQSNLTFMLCYPYDLNGTGTPTTNENVLIEGSVPAQGATIETTDTITYTFNNDSVKPAIYDLSNKNMLVGRFADGRFTFGSQYEGDVVWTASTKQISIRRKQGWLTGSCNLWFQAADDQT